MPTARQPRPSPAPASDKAVSTIFQPLDPLNLICLHGGGRSRPPWQDWCCSLADWPRQLCLHKLNIQRDGYLVAHQDATGFERRVPAQPKVLPVDARRCRQPDSRIAPWVFRRSTGSLDFKYYAARDPTNGKIALDRELSV